MCGGDAAFCQITLTTCCNCGCASDLNRERRTRPLVGQVYMEVRLVFSVLFIVIIGPFTFYRLALR